MLAVDDLAEAADRLGDGHILALHSRELLSHAEGLGQEPLDLPGAGDSQLVLLAQLVHTHDGDDVLQILVALQNALHIPRHLIVLFAHDLRGQDAAGRFQRIHGRINTQRGNAAIQHGGGIQVGVGGGGRGVGQVVGGDIHRLYGGDGALLGGGDTLLQRAHLGSQRGLIAHGGGHAPQQSGHLAAGLGKPENVVNEQQHVLVLLVAEVLGHGQSAERHAHTGSGRLVHLAVDQCGLVQNAAFGHLVVQVVALAGTLAHAGEHGDAAVLLGHVVDQLHDQHGLAHAGAAEQADLAALGIGADQIHHLDAGFKDLRGALLLLIGGCGTVDGPALLGFGGGAVVHRLAQQIENTAKACLAHGNSNGAAGVRGGNAALQAVGAAHGNAANHIVADMLRHLRHQLFPVVLDLNGVEQLRHRIVGKTDVQHGAYRLHDGAHVFLCHRIVSFSVIHTAHLPRSL